jgi:hypothetical protein
MSIFDINFKNLELNLKLCGSDWFASQCHGLICARLSVLGPNSLELCLSQIFEHSKKQSQEFNQLQEEIRDLFNATWAKLDGRQSDFDLLLPIDESSIKGQTIALSQWCDGFLHGIVTGKNSEALKSLFSKEPISIIIKDMVELTRATVSSSDDDEELGYFIEIREYLRTCTQLVYEELTDFRDSINNIKSN